MPLIQVTAPQASLDKSGRNELMNRLSDAVLRAERAPVEDAGAQGLVWAYFHEMPDGDMYVGGVNVEQPPIRIAVTTPEGALNDVSRKHLFEDIGRIVDDVVGTFEGRLNHWVMLYEVADGSWGGAGQVFHLPDIQAAMSIQAA